MNFKLYSEKCKFLEFKACDSASIFLLALSVGGDFDDNFRIIGFILKNKEKNVIFGQKWRGFLMKMDYFDPKKLISDELNYWIPLTCEFYFINKFNSRTDFWSVFVFEVEIELKSIEFDCTYC